MQVNRSRTPRPQLAGKVRPSLAVGDDDEINIGTREMFVVAELNRGRAENGQRLVMAWHRFANTPTKDVDQSISRRLPAWCGCCPNRAGSLP